MEQHSLKSEEIVCGPCGRGNGLFQTVMVSKRTCSHTVDGVRCGGGTGGKTLTRRTRWRDERSGLNKGGTGRHERNECVLGP